MHKVSREENNAEMNHRSHMHVKKPINTLQVLGDITVRKGF